MRRFAPYLVSLAAALFLSACGSDKVVSPKSPASRLAFISYRDGLRQAYVIRADGSGLVRISHTTGPAYSPRWAPTGDRILFSSGESIMDIGLDIFLVASNGTGQVNLTNSPGVFDGEHQWSPDGTRIAFVTTRDEGNAEVYVMSSSGSNPQRLTDNPSMDNQPLWSPTGDWISFISTRNDTTDLYATRPDGSDLLRLTRSATVEYDPAWSPDGSSLAFRGGNIDTTQIFVVRLDGSDPTPLTNSPSSASEPSWSPDGMKIAYLADDGIHVMDRDGSNDHWLTSTNWRDHKPVWSPDGQTIAFVYRENFNWDVFLMAADGSGRRNLSQSASTDDEPAWRPLPR